LTALCRQVVGREVDVDSEPATRQADLRLFMADCGRLFQRTTWRPRRDMNRIISDIFEWVRKNEQVLKPLV